MFPLLLLLFVIWLGVKGFFKTKLFAWSIVGIIGYFFISIMLK